MPFKFIKQNIFHLLIFTIHKDGMDFVSYILKKEPQNTTKYNSSFLLYTDDLEFEFQKESKNLYVTLYLITITLWCSCDLAYLQFVDLCLLVCWEVDQQIVLYLEREPSALCFPKFGQNLLVL